MSVHLARAGLMAKQTVGGGGGGVDSPDDVAGLWGWWKGADLTGADGAAVSQWSDVSGNSRHFVQATGANQPVKKTAIVNGHDVLRFDGSNDFMLYTGTVAGEANPSDLTIFVVGKTTDQASSHTPLASRDGGANGWLMRYSTSGGLFGHLGATPNVTNTFTSTNWNIFQVVRTALSCRVGVNGTMGSATAISAYPGASTALALGGEDSSGPNTVAPNSNFMFGDIAEVIIYSTAVSDSDRDALETYLGNKYSISVA